MFASSGTGTVVEFVSKASLIPKTEAVTTAGLVRFIVSKYVDGVFGKITLASTVNPSSVLVDPEINGDELTLPVSRKL